MQSYLLMGLISIEGSNSFIYTSKSSLDPTIGLWSCNPTRCRTTNRRLSSPVSVSRHQNHYDVLGVSPDVSSSDIKKAYRLLALKYHPDVSKDSSADDMFKSIRFAYDFSKLKGICNFNYMGNVTAKCNEDANYISLAVLTQILSNEITRSQYDRSFQAQVNPTRPQGDYWDYNLEVEDTLRVNRWADLRRKMRQERYRHHKEKYNETARDSEDEAFHYEERGSFVEVLQSAFLSIFLMLTIGPRLSLTFSSLMALRDDNLDAGYKTGYMIACALGGKGGILLTLCLSFASWVCGKTSSSVVAVLVVAMWVGPHLARFAPVPQGALITLIYMSIKLQADLS